MSLNALAANVATFASAEGDGEFHTPTPNDFWLPIVGDGTWAITEQMVWMAVSVIVLYLTIVICWLLYVSLIAPRSRKGSSS